MADGVLPKGVRQMVYFTAGVVASVLTDLSDDAVFNIARVSKMYQFTHLDA